MKVYSIRKLPWHPLYFVLPILWLRLQSLRSFKNKVIRALQLCESLEHWFNRMQPPTQLETVLLIEVDLWAESLQDLQPYKGMPGRVWSSTSRDVHRSMFNSTESSFKAMLCTTENQMANFQISQRLKIAPQMLNIALILKMSPLVYFSVVWDSQSPGSRTLNRDRPKLPI